MHWTLHYVRLPSSTINSIVQERSQPSQELTWCGVVDCPYPYVTVGSVRLSSPAEIDSNAVREGRSPEANPWMIWPQWGTYTNGSSMVDQNGHTNGVDDSGSDSEST